MSSNLPANTSNDRFEQLVVFKIANEFYGVDMTAVDTIIRMQEITVIPRTPYFIEGVINLRGSIVPVINMLKRFDLEIHDTDKSSRIVVVDIAGQKVGMIVDEVDETVQLPASSIEPPSPVISSMDASFLRGVGKQDNRLLIILNLDHMLTPREQNTVRNISHKAQNIASKSKAA